MKILVPIFENFEDIELVAPLDLWSRSGIEYTKYSLENQKIVRGNKNALVETQTTPVNPQEFDAIFLHGGPAVNAMRKNAKLIEIVKEFKRQAKPIFAICDAPNFLVENNVIEGEKYASYPIANLVKTDHRVADGKVIIDHKLVTGAGPGVAIDFALAVIDYVQGSAAKDRIVKMIRY